MVESQCAELNLPESRPKQPGYGELLQYRPSAFPSVGFVVALTPKTSAKDWKDIGLRCSTCKGFGLVDNKLSLSEASDKAVVYKGSIDLVQKKVGKSKKWLATPLKDIKPCGCNIDLPESLPELG